MLIRLFSRSFRTNALLIIGIQVVFIVAKIVGVLTLSWLWVFAPLLFTAAVLAIVLCVAAFLISGY